MLNHAAQQRIAALPTLITTSAKILCNNNDLAFDQTIETDIFFGYLTGYPHCFDSLSTELGGVVRKVLFDGCYGQNGEEFARRAFRLINRADADANTGFGFGVPDGERFLQALTQSRQANDCTDSLKAMFAIKITPQPSLQSDISEARSSTDDLASRKNALRDRLSRF